MDALETITIAPADANKPSLMHTLRRLETEVATTIEFFKGELRNISMSDEVSLPCCVALAFAETHVVVSVA
jgi:hypothetical protein